MDGPNVIAVDADRHVSGKRAMGLAILVASVFIGGGFILKAPPYASVFPSPAAIQGNLNQPALPIVVQYRPALILPGMVLKVSNRSAQHLALHVTLTNPTLGNPRHSTLDIEPGSAMEIGAGEALQLGHGDTVRLSQKDYRIWIGRIP